MELLLVQPKPSTMKKISVEIVCALLVLLWVYVAVSKLLDYGTFVSQLEKSPYTTGYAEWVGWLVPAVELITAMVLITRLGRMIGLYSSLFLLLLFSGYIYAILNYSYFIPCSCGGIISKMTWEQHLVFNLVFVGLTIGAILLSNTSKQNHSSEAVLLRS